MKTITATEANHDFSKLLEEVSAGEVIGVTKHGRIIATINPVVQQDEAAAQEHIREHLKRLREQPVLNIPGGTRDELYGD